MTVRYLHGPGVDNLLGRVSASGETSWYVADRLGSVRKIVDAFGAVSYSADYDAFGKKTSESGSGDRWGWTGREWDAVSGLQYNRARYYDPQLGRWTAKDPIGFAAGDANLYRYVGNGPTNATDPSGLEVYVWEPFKSFCYSFFVEGIYGGGRALATGEAGEALGTRAVAMAENRSGEDFTGTGEDWGRFAQGVGGDLTGVNGLTEAASGHDLATQGQLSAEERWQRGLAGTGSLAGTAAGLGAAAKAATARAAAGTAGAEAAAATAARTAGAEAAAARTAAAAERGVKSPSKTINCFPPETLVGTEQGLRAIGSIEAGERVWSFDFERGEWRLATVECRHDSIFEGDLITVETAEGEVTATERHPFWVTSGEDLESRKAPEHVGADEDRGGALAGRWINSDDLRVGDMVFLRGRGEVRIDRIGVRRERASVCNLTVRELHTFAVGAIQTLVHNSSGSSETPNANPSQCAAPVTPPLRPEKIYTGSKKHGVDWKEGSATAKNLGKPQGQWTKKDLEFGGEKASTLAPGEGQSFPLPEESTSVVHLPNGTTVKATHIWVRNNGSGTFHGYPHLGDR